MSTSVSIFWFRRDLRLEDNTGLLHALAAGRPVLPVFIFDSQILDRLEDRRDRRVEFILGALGDLRQQLERRGGALRVEAGNPPDVLERLAAEYSVSAVFTNHDYEPYALRRDATVRQLLEARGIAFHTFKDQVIFEKEEVLKSDGTPYTVFTPYGRRWRQRLEDEGAAGKPSGRGGKFLQESARPLPTLKQLGFEPAGLRYAAPEFPTAVIRNYHETRNRPAVHGTSHLSVHLRFGTVSIRDLVARACKLNDAWLNELIWREFFMSILYHFPYVVERSFKPAYDAIPWVNDETAFARWCEGRTGYPLVDAGMRELNATGFMHNRVRMVTASFLTKHLLIDWRWGEAYFAKKLLDFELSSNNGNWQWAAGCGCDAAPYFRIFNPSEQARRFDPGQEYIRRWVPETGTPSYPAPLVDHRQARERALKIYRQALSAYAGSSR